MFSLNSGYIFFRGGNLFLPCFLVFFPKCLSPPGAAPTKTLIIGKNLTLNNNVKHNDAMVKCINTSKFDTPTLKSSVSQISFI